MKFAIFPVLLLAAVPALAEGPVPPVPFAISPMQAIETANANAPAGVLGLFDLTIRTTGRQDGFLYLNTENDYRDQRNVTVDIPPPVEDELTAKYGKLDNFFVGKHLHVRGVARRVKITFTSNGMPTEKYYYQTHVGVVNASQITFVDDK